MPELPDVEGHRRALTEVLVGAQVQAVDVLDASVLRNATAAAFRDRLLGSRFGTPDRRGKWLILPTGGPTLLIHNGMTGRPYFLDVTDPSVVARDDRLIVHTDRGELHYADRRKLRGVWLIDHDADRDQVIGEQGPDALGLSADGFKRALAGRRGAIKTLLMDQRVIAGLGNMLSDEILWRARIHPSRPASSLGADELRRLQLQLRRTLSAAVAQGRIPRDKRWLNYARVPDGSGQPGCPRCGAPVERTRIGGRTSLWCPRCQPADPG
jgi:formamidopyrimidine-DNA glycosylase